jgi:hypothetical protein
MTALLEEIIMIHRQLILAAALIGLAAPASAQLPSLGSLGGGGSALSGLGGGVLPNVSSVGAGNAAGLLGYCVKRKLLGGANASSVLGKLTGKQGVTTSDDYAAGQNGQLVTGNGTVSLDGMKDKVKGKVCSMVLDHAQGFAGL